MKRPFGGLRAFGGPAVAGRPARILPSAGRFQAVRSNPAFQGTVGKLRLPIPSALRAPAAPELQR